MSTSPITNRPETRRESGKREAFAPSANSKSGERVITEQQNCEELLEYVEFVRRLIDLFRKEDLIHQMSFIAQWDRPSKTVRQQRFISYLWPVYRSLQALSSVCIRASAARKPVLEELEERAAALEAKVRRVMSRDRNQSQ
ncbi:MAG: hypothetical protein QOI07_3242 [Verrucomicrobiota bacterium]|jgi:FPC/CPF motif-containing protein YcgG